MKHVGWDKAVVAGLSMASRFSPFPPRVCRSNARAAQGGGIVASFAAKYPEMVDEKLVLLAPAGLLKVRRDRDRAEWGPRFTTVDRSPMRGSTSARS